LYSGYELFFGVSILLYRCVKGLLDICDDVAHVLDTYRQADEIWCDTGFAQLLVRELAVSVAGGM
jgi:hypothetical protein